MNETPQFRCGDTEALVTYLYDESSREERRAIDAHLVTCASCTEEIMTLRGTRAELAEWTPPQVDLGFRMTSAPTSEAAARVLRPARWWSRPLPAWAQAAAAAAIFAAGLTIGGTRQATAARTTDAARTASQGQRVSFIAPSTVSRDDLDNLEQRLREEIALARDSAQTRTSPASRGNDDLFGQVRALIAESERRQQQFVVAKTVQVATQLEERHRADLVQVQQAMGEIENVTGATMRNQDQLGKFIGAPTGGLRVRMVNTTTGR